MAGLREKQKKEKEFRIIKASLTLFTSKGFNETTMEEIAEKSEVGVGTLYNYVKSKGDLLLLILTDKTDDLYIEAEKIIENPGSDVVDTLVELLKIYLQGLFLSMPQHLIKDFFSVIFSQQYDESNFGKLIKLDYKLMNQVTALLNVYIEKGLIDSSVNIEILSFNLYSIVIMQFMGALMQEPIPLEMLTEVMRAQIMLIYNGFKPVIEED